MFLNNRKALRNRLLAEVADPAKLPTLLPCGHKRRSSDKNSLDAGDAKAVEDAFEQKLSELSEPAVSDQRSDAGIARTQATAIQQSGSPPERLSTAVTRQGLTRAYSRLARHAAIATRNISDLSPSSHACYAPASPRIRIIFGSCSRARSAARRATNSPCRSAADIIGQRIVRATNEHGGRRPASTRSKSPASFGHARGAAIPG